MFEYKCLHCGWVIKSPVIFQEKKPCLNCDGFVELQVVQADLRAHDSDEWRRLARRSLKELQIGRQEKKYD